MTAFTIDARLPEIARLRLAGATRRQVSRSILTEVLGVALASSAIGWIAGWPVGAVIQWLLVRMEFAPPGLDVSPLPWSPPVVLGLGLLITFLGARPAARRAGRTDPLIAVTDVVPARRAMPVARWVVAVLGLGGLAGMAQARVTSIDDVFGFTLLSCLLVVTTLACLAPVLVPAVTRVLGAPLTRWWPGPGLLAVEHTRYAVRRSAALALPVLIVAGLCGGLLTILDTANGGRGTDTRADLVVLGPTLPLDPALAAVDGVTAVTELEVLAITAATDQRDADDAPEEETWYVGALDVAGAESRGLVSTTDRDGQAPAGTVPVTSVVPGALPLGASLTITPPTGPPVVLLVTAVADLDPALAGDVLIDPALVGDWATTVDTAAVLTVAGSTTTTGTAAAAHPATATGTGTPPDLTTVRDRVAAVVGDADVYTGADFAQQQADANSRNNRYAVLALLGGGIALAGCSIVLGGLSGAADRRREFGGLVRSGATHRQILGSAAVETVLVLVVAALLAVGTVAWVAWRLDSMLLVTEPPRVAAGPMALALVVATVLALAATLAGTGWQLRRIARQ